MSTVGREAAAQQDGSGDIEMMEVDSTIWTVGVKPRQPRAYSGNRGEIDTFLYSLEVYFNIADPQDRMSEEQKTLAASSYLEGSAARWFQTYLKDRITKVNHLEKTKIMFSDFEAFKQELQSVFGITNEVRRAELQLAKLRQIDWPRSGPVRTVAFFGDRLKRLDRTVQHLQTAVRSQKYKTGPFGPVFLLHENGDR